MLFKHYSTRDIFQVDNDLLITLLGSVWSMSHEDIQWDCHSSQYSDICKGISLSEIGGGGKKKNIAMEFPPEYWSHNPLTSIFKILVKASNVAQLVECLSGMHKALGSVPNAWKVKAGGEEVQGHHPP